MHNTDDDVTFADWETWFTLRGLFMDSSQGAETAHRVLSARGVTLSDVGAVWEWVQAKRGLDSPESFFTSKILKPTDFVTLVSKVRRFKTDGEKPAQRNMERDQAVEERRLRDEWIAAHVQERRTVDWVMRKEMMLRSEVLAVLDRLAPHAVKDEWRHGVGSPWELPDEFQDCWRREDEAALIRKERGELFTAAAGRKVARRKAAGQPLPGATERRTDSNGQTTTALVTPEDIQPTDFGGINP